MNPVVRTIKGSPSKFGNEKMEGHYSVFEFIEFKTNDGELIKIENIAIESAMKKELNNSVASVQLLDGNQVNKWFDKTFICGIQNKKENVFVDSKIIDQGYKGKIFAAIALTVLPPLTLIAPWFYYQANKLKNAKKEVGVFEPIDKNFITPTKKKNF